ncbi:MAG: DUF6502 family protein [Gammaproteobacteria bacterium]|jgi:hypothetical protein|nr:DUF6502 family protein [Gammaproteobacteria bacterium]
MQNLDQAAIKLACRSMLRPVASFLLKCGLTFREFADLSKSVFVETATEEYGIRGRPTNVSRVALLTGISRKEVSRQRALLAAAPAPPANKTTDATRLLSGWHQDPDFVGADGRPLPLPFEAPGGRSFSALCHRYAPDIPASTMLKELKRVGAVEEAADHQLHARLRYYMPTRFDPQWVLNAGSVFADLGANINYNLAVEAAPTRFLGRATDTRIAPDAVPAFYAFMEERGQQFLEEVDSWLAAHRAAADTEVATVRLGAGAFLIQDDPQD